MPTAPHRSRAATVDYPQASSTPRHPGRDVAANRAVAYLGRDVRLADRLAETLQADGWDVTLSRDEAGGWMAEVFLPQSSLLAIGRGGSRLVAISQAHVAALQTLADSRHHQIQETGNRR